MKKLYLKQINLIFIAKSVLFLKSVVHFSKSEIINLWFLTFLPDTHLVLKDEI